MIRVAAGVLRRADGAVLIAQRPQGKIAAGKWEFPGGKIEAGESAYEALCRELHEELHITVGQARPLIGITHAYTERTVHLDTWLVTDWDGEPYGREDQALAWSAPDSLADWDLLAADGPIVSALLLPPLLAVSPAGLRTLDQLTGWAEGALTRGAGMLRIRAQSTDGAGYQALCAELLRQRPDLAACCQIDVPDLARAGGWAGCHFAAADMPDLKVPPERGGARWWSASVHDEWELERAHQLALDFVVAGHVQATASHPDVPGRGWAWVADLAANARCPVYAIGGLGPEDVAAAQKHGGQGVAAIGAFLSA